MTWRGLTFDTTNPEVYPPKPATLLLAEAAIKTIKPGEKFLEIGTGSGAVAIAVAKFVRGVKVVASDISSEAVKTAAMNAKNNKVAITTVRGNLFKPFKKNRFDVIAIHPPAVPYPRHKTWGLTKGMTLATNGGSDGSKLVVQSIEHAAKYLKPNGRLLLLLPHWSNTQKAYEALLKNYSAIKKLSEKTVEFFPMIEGRPTKRLLRYIKSLLRSGTIELLQKRKRLFSRVSVIQAIK